MSNQEAGDFLTGNRDFPIRDLDFAVRNWKKEAEDLANLSASSDEQMQITRGEDRDLVANTSRCLEKNIVMSQGKHCDVLANAS